MRLIRKSTIRGTVGLTATAVTAILLATPGTAQAAPYWSVACDKWAAAGDPGSNDMTASLWRSSDPNKGAVANFKGNGETFSARNWAGASVEFIVQWATADGTRIEREWVATSGTGDSVSANFDIPEGRTVWISAGTPGGSTAICKGKA